MQCRIRFHSQAFRDGKGQLSHIQVVYHILFVYLTRVLRRERFSKVKNVQSSAVAILLKFG